MSDQPRGDEHPLEGGASHETDRLTENQPPREDVIPTEALEELEPTEADPLLSEDDAVLPRPASEDLPETQGVDVDQGKRVTEEYAERPRMHDEEM